MPKFIDLNAVVEEWGWRKYADSATSKKQRQLLDKMQSRRRQRDPCIGVNIDWSQVEFTNHTTWGRLADDEFADTNSNTGQSPDQPGELNGALPADLQQVSDVNVLFTTEFSNDTEKEQVYTLHVEKTTRSTCSTEVEHGVTKGIELGVSLKMPTEVFEANAGFKREVSLTKTEGETIEEELNWGAESTITVAIGKVAKARLIVREKKQCGDFTVLTKIRGNVLVGFTNKSDNNSLLFSQSGDIDYIMEQYLERNTSFNSFVKVMDDNVVQIKTKGQCKFRYGIKQEVGVVQSDLNRALSPPAR